MKEYNLNRRDFLKTFAIAAAALPFAGTFVHAAIGGPIKRLVLMQHPDGINPAQWYPSGGERNFTLPPMIEPFGKVKNECVFIRGLNIYGSVGHGAYMKLWRGDKTRESIDSYFAEKWRGEAPIAQLYMKAAPGAYGGRSLCYDANGRALPMIRSTSTILNKVYTSDTLTADLSAAMARKQRRLGIVQAELTGIMNGNMANDDILKSHKKSVDDILDALNNIDPSAVQVDMSAWKAQYDGSHNSSNEFDNIAYKMEDMIFAALKYDRCRIINYSFGADVWDYNMLCDDGNRYPYHNSGHAMNHGHVQTRKQTSKHVADFIQRLRDEDDIYGNPLLDSTLVVYACEIGHAAGHSTRDLPFILAGAGLEGGRNLNYNGTNWNKMLISIANILGDPMTRYGGDGNYTDGGLDGLV